MLPYIKLIVIHYRGQESIGLSHSLDIDLAKEIKKVKGIKWSSQHRCWYVGLNRESYDILKASFIGKAILDTSVLAVYLDQKKGLGLLGNDKISKSRALALIQHPLNEGNLKAFKKFQDMLVLK